MNIYKYLLEISKDTTDLSLQMRESLKYVDMLQDGGYRSIEASKQLIETLKKISVTDMSKIKNDIENLKSRSGVTSSSINRYFGVVSRMLTFATKKDKKITRHYSTTSKGEYHDSTYGTSEEEPQQSPEEKLSLNYSSVISDQDYQRALGSLKSTLNIIFWVWAAIIIGSIIIGVLVLNGNFTKKIDNNDGSIKYVSNLTSTVFDKVKETDNNMDNGTVIGAIFFINLAMLLLYCSYVSARDKLIDNRNDILFLIDFSENFISVFGKNK